MKDTITIRQRKTIGIPLIAKTVFTLYPKRTVLCFSLFVGQAFLYNAFFFTYGDTLTTFLGVGQTGYYIAVFAVSNFAGALLLGPLFDSVGRVKMITGTYIALRRAARDRGLHARRPDRHHPDHLRRGDLLLRLGRRQLGVPHRERGVPDGDPGPVHRVLLRDRYGGRRHHRPAAVRQADRQRVARAVTSPGSRRATSSGAGLMIAGGIVAAFLGVKAEGQSLESIAQPLTAEDAETGGQPEHANA